jgi:hypothetical protein
MLVSANNQQRCFRRPCDQRARPGSSRTNSKIHPSPGRIPHGRYGLPVKHVDIAFLYGRLGHGNDADRVEVGWYRPAVDPPLTANSLCPVKRACSAAHGKAARLDGDKSRPTRMLLISLLLRVDTALAAQRR